MRVVSGLLLSSLAALVTCFTPPSFFSWKSSTWPRYPPSAADVHPSAGLDVRMFRTRRTTTDIPLQTRRKAQLPRSSALDEAPFAESAAAAATHVVTFGDGSNVASTVAEDDRSPSSSSSGAVDGSSAPLIPTVATATSAAAASSAWSSSLLPLALLNAVTLLWGTQHAVIKLILQEDLSPGVTNFARFGIAALLFSPWTPGVLRDPPSIPFSPPAAEDVGDADAAEARREDEIGGDGDGGGGGGGSATDAWRAGGATEAWRAGAELGLWMFMGFAFQSIGLEYTTAR